MAFNKAKALQEAEKSRAQGKISQAIKVYLDVFSKDPSDLSLLNTVGDLYVREKNVPEALKQFHKLAEAYTQEGFTVRAIAICKKISKLDPSNVDVLLKMGELYTVQGLGREAREQYTQAVDFFRKKNQNDRALEAFRKIVLLDPENATYRAKFAEFCEHIGKKSEAAVAYQEAAETALRKADLVGAETALAKASSLDPRNLQVPILRARLALCKNRPEEAEEALTSTPDLTSDPGAQRLLLETYLGLKKLTQAKQLVSLVFRSRPGDFAPLENFARVCLERGECDAALGPLAEASDILIQHKSVGPLMEVLREILAKEPRHLPTLELFYKVAEKTADESTLPEVLQALGDAYAHEGNLERAEWAFRKLVDREPQNEDYKGLLKGVLKREGKEATVASAEELSSVEMALTPEGEAEISRGYVRAPVVSPEEAAMVKEALDNSDLFARYNLVDKAIGELETVLTVYPDQVDIRQRIIEVAQKARPQRAQQEAEALARIYGKRGDEANARRYEAMAHKGPFVMEPGIPGAAAEPSVAPSTKVPEVHLPGSGLPGAAEVDLSKEFPGITSAEVPAAPASGGLPAQASAEARVDSAATPPSGLPPEALPQEQEFDLSGALEETVPMASAGVEAPAGAAQFNYEESRVEVEFYLEQGFVEEARKTVAALEEKFPGNVEVAELGRAVAARAAEVSSAAPGLPEAEPAALQGDEWELPTSFAEPEVVAGPASAPEQTAPAPEAEPVEVDARTASPSAPSPPETPPGGAGDLLGSLAGELAPSLEGFEGKAPPVSPSASSAKSGPPAAMSGVSPLSELLEELGEGGEAESPAEDRQTHYDLGVAFREMNLLDEAIGEFQKVVKGAQKGKLPANFLQACTLLGLCFMEKKMPAIAAKWYARALEIPDLDEEATLALLYDLGVAFEKAGDARTALEKFSEVYSQNIDYRDVAEKIRTLQQKA